jgi:DNA segregation ATPase FtsK/SpoIIIE, S-DNA-T family
MRIDVTIADRDGGSVDVAVRGPADSTLDQLSTALRRHCDDRTGAAGQATGSGPVARGRSPVRSGSRLDADGVPVPRGRHVGWRLHVVSGPDAGTQLPLAPGVHTIGRDPGGDLVLADPGVSRQHVRVSVAAGAATVRDLDSTHGTTVEGRGVSALEDRSWSVGELIRIGDTYLALRVGSDPPAVVRDGPDASVLVQRSAGPAPVGTVVIDADGRSPNRHPTRIPWLAAFLPLVAGVVLALMMHSAQFLAFALLSPVVLLGTALSDRVHLRRQGRTQAALGDTQTRETAAAIAVAISDEVGRRRAAAPDPPDVAEIARGPGSRIWQRWPGLGLLRVRIGLGELPSGARVRRDAESEPAAMLIGVPIEADLEHGGLGIAAPGPLGPALARWVVAQLAVLVSPADLEVSVLTDAARERDWCWIRWLPHWRGRVAVDAAERTKHVKALTDLVAERRTARRSDQPFTGPRHLVVVDGDVGPGELSCLHSLLADGPAVGLTAVWVAARPPEVPPGCWTIVTAAGETGTQVDVIETTGERRRAIADQVSVGWAEETARLLAPLADITTDLQAAIPDRVRLREVLGRDHLDPAALIENWTNTGGAATATLGLSADGPFGIDLDRDGPHALIAGTTGSGKSELLQTLIIGLAVASPPDELAFILVDYKGGAAFAECSRLPHTVGLVTDLDTHLTRRALTSLDSELRRRERLFRDAGASDLASYRATAGADPLARLVLVVDEFATLADELPDFIGGLIAIAQRGRSLGVHLVLATQRPGGVVSPEIRANSALRIALRVTDASESSDVIDAPDAARISRHRPGRCCIRSGTTVTAVQIAYAGAGPADSADESIRISALDRWRRPLTADHVDRSPDTDLLRAVAVIRAAVEQSGRPAPHRPWLPPLPAQLDLSRALESPAAADRPELVAYGRADEPAEQGQPVQSLDLTRGGSILFAGTTGSGRTSALLALALQAAEQLAPTELHLYGIDAGGGLSALNRLPHAATIAPVTDPDLVVRLLERLAARFAAWPAQLARIGCSSVEQARARGHRFPLSLLLIDGWEGYVAASDDVDSGRGVALVLSLLRSGSAAGLTVALAGDRGCLAPRIAGAVATRYLLRLADRSDYGLAGLAARQVPGRMEPGRAVRAGDGIEVQLASLGADRDALPAILHRIADRWADSTARSRSHDDDSDDDSTDDIDTGGATNNDSGEDAIADTDPIAVRALPAQVRRPTSDDAPHRVTGGRGLYLGLGGDAAEPVLLDLLAGAGRLLVAGPPRSGRTTVLLSLLQQAGERGVPVLVAAPTRSPLHEAGRRLDGTVSCRPDETPSGADWPDHPRSLLLIDDVDAFVDTAAEAALLELIRHAPRGVAVVGAGRTDELVLSYRGLGYELRRARCALLLQPGPGDGELVGLRLPFTRAPLPPGRGVLIPDPAWGPTCRQGPLPVQVATP